MSKHGLNVLPTTRSYGDGTSVLKSHPKDRKSDLAIPGMVVSLLFTTPPTLLGHGLIKLPNSPGVPLINQTSSVAVKNLWVPDEAV